MANKKLLLVLMMLSLMLYKAEGRYLRHIQDQEEATPAGVGDSGPASTVVVTKNVTETTVQKKEVTSADSSAPAPAASGVAISSVEFCKCEGAVAVTSEQLKLAFGLEKTPLTLPTVNWTNFVSSVKSCQPGYYRKTADGECEPIDAILMQDLDVSNLLTEQDIVVLRRKQREFILKYPNFRFITCPADKPFLTKNLTCSECAEPTNLWNLDTLECVKCDEGKVYDAATRKCKSLSSTRKYTNIKSIKYILFCAGTTADTINADIQKVKDEAAKNSSITAEQCGEDLPFSLGDRCIACGGATPYFNYCEKKCVACAENEEFDQTTQTCVNVAGGYYTDFSNRYLIVGSGSNFTEVVTKIKSTITRRMKECPKNAPFFNGRVCIACEAPLEYFDLEGNHCVGCTNGTFNERERKCEIEEIVEPIEGKFKEQSSTDVKSKATKEVEETVEPIEGKKIYKTVVENKTESTVAKQSSTSTKTTTGSTQASTGSSETTTTTGSESAATTGGSETTTTTTGGSKTTGGSEASTGDAGSATTGTSSSTTTTTNTETTTANTGSSTSTSDKSGESSTTASSGDSSSAATAATAGAAGAVAGAAAASGVAKSHFRSNLKNNNWITEAGNVDNILSSYADALVNNKENICAEETPFWNGKECISCEEGKYFEFGSNQCQSPSGDRVFNGNLHQFVTKESGRITDLSASKIDYNGNSADEIKQRFAALSKADPAPTPCPTDKPYYDDVTCISCPDRLPIFNIEKKTCGACERGQIWSEDRHSCVDDQNKGKSAWTVVKGLGSILAKKH